MADVDDGYGVSEWQAVDLFAGPGGWDVAAYRFGLRVVGIEFDAAACNTRRAAGLHTVEGDVRAYSPADFYYPPGLIASPPCQTFSVAGKGAGRRALDVVVAAIAAMMTGEPLPTEAFDDERTALVLDPLRWVLDAHRDGRPFEWLAFEQVATVLPVWRAYADALRTLGYEVATGTLSAEQYGAPQTRKRAILVARLGEPVELPRPTHSRYHSRTPERLDEGVLPWVSMAEALGWGATHRPSMTVTGGGAATGGAEPFGNAARQGLARERDAGRWANALGAERFADQSGTPVDRDWPLKRPSTTLATRDFVQHPGATANRYNGSTKSRNDGVRVTPEEAAILQTFPADYPWQGMKTKVYQQIGNAIPPLLAEAILAVVSSSGLLA